MKLLLPVIALLVLGGVVGPKTVSAQTISRLRAGLGAAPIVSLSQPEATAAHVAGFPVARGRPSYMGAVFGFLAGAVLAIGVHRSDKVVVFGAFGAVIGLIVGS